MPSAKPAAAREGIYTAHESMESYRLTAQRTIIGGPKDVRYFYDCAPHNHGGDDDARKMSVIISFRQRFPMLGELPVAQASAHRLPEDGFLMAALQALFRVHHAP